MSMARRRCAVLGAVAVAAVLSVASCINPFEPISKSDKIEGLSYVDFALSWERWDSDPAYDGVLIAPEYSNEYGDSLEFHDKPHRIVIEFYKQEEGEDVDAPVRIGDLFFSRSVEYENSDDEIRIPIEAYRSALEGADYDLTATVDMVFVIMRVFPPEGFPREELVIGYRDQKVFVPETDESGLEPADT